jgi:hypothetical protein
MSFDVVTMSFLCHLMSLLCRFMSFACHLRSFAAAPRPPNETMNTKSIRPKSSIVNWKHIYRSASKEGLKNKKSVKSVLICVKTAFPTQKRRFHPKPHVRNCQKVSQTVTKCQKMSVSVSKCQKVSVNVSKCQKLSVSPRPAKPWKSGVFDPIVNRPSSIVNQNALSQLKTKN